MKHHHERDKRHTYSTPHFQKYIRFLPIVVSDFPEVRQKRANKCLLLTCFWPVWLKICHDGGHEGGLREHPEGTEDKRESGYMESMQKRTPPPLGKRQEPSTPIIFRTKNTGKSRLGLIGKNFRKQFAGKCFGERKAPNLVERGRSAKIRKISLRMQR